MVPTMGAAAGVPRECDDHVMTKQRILLLGPAVTLLLGAVACDGGGSMSTTPSSPPPSAPTVVSSPPSPPELTGSRRTYPNSPQEAASYFGGTASEWFRHGPNGWMYRNSGSGALHFIVPDNCVVHMMGVRHRPGETIDATRFTIYWIK